MSNKMDKIQKLYIVECNGAGISKTRRLKKDEIVVDTFTLGILYAMGAVNGAKLQIDSIPSSLLACGVACIAYSAALIGFSASNHLLNNCLINGQF